MSISYWLENKSSSTQSYDLVIIGAGIAGLSAAYWWQKKNPRDRIAIVEKNRLGFGASGRNAGFVTCGSTEHFIKLQEQFGLAKALEIWKFSEENHRLLKQEIVQEDGDSVDYKLTGSCTVAPSEIHWQKYQSVAKTMKAAGLDMIEVSPSDLEKNYGVSGFVGGLQYQGDGYIHPIKLLKKIYSRLSVDLIEGTEVFAIEKKSDHSLIRTDQGVLTTAKLIISVNAYLPLLLQDFRSLITPGRGQILLTEPLPAFVQGPCYLTKHLCYFRQLPTGHLLIGGFRNLALADENTYADETTPVIQGALLDFVRSHFKYGGEAKVAHKWSGIMGFSKDGQMLLGNLPDHPHVHVMAGCSGHGMGLSFHAAKVLVESVTGQEIPTHLRLQRFLR